MFVERPGLVCVLARSSDFGGKGLHVYIYKLCRDVE